MTATARPAVVVGADAAEVARLAAEHLVAAVSKAEGAFTWALSGGSTPKALYALLAADEFRSRVPWDRVHVFFADERAVPPDHPDSNFGMVRALLLSQAPIPEDHVHRMVGEAEDLAAAAANYEGELSAVCPVAGPGGVPSLDLVLLGIGEDGHTASLLPGTMALEETTRWVVANSVPQLRATRLTLTRPALSAARTLLFLATGQTKAGIVRRVLEGDASLPAARVAAEARQATFLLDEAAATEWHQAHAGSVS